MAKSKTLRQTRKSQFSNTFETTKSLETINDMGNFLPGIKMENKNKEQVYEYIDNQI